MTSHPPGWKSLANDPHQGRLALLLQVAIGAGRVTLEHFRTASLQVEAKADDSPVTIADRSAEQWARAEIAQAYDVTNVYADIGQSFANTIVDDPRVAAAMLGILVKGLGPERVIWGTDAVWTGSPQWQIEGLRRLEIPEEMQRAHGFAALGAADGPTKTAIFSGNASRLFNLEPQRAADRFDAYKTRYLAEGAVPSNRRYGYIAA